MTEKDTKFLEMFPGCDILSGTCGGLENAYVTEVIVDQERMAMKLSAFFARMPAPAETGSLEKCIAGQYGLEEVNIITDFPQAQAERSEAAEGGKALMGRPGKGKTIPMKEIGPDSGSVAVAGEVFSVQNREIQRRGASVLSFDMTDYTGSVRVSKFIAAGEDRSILNKVSEGQFLTVRGKVTYNKFDDDLVIEPRSITLDVAEVRPDNSEKKRVELHLHTRYSALDALTDPAKVVERAAFWGHPAIAVTDHGVAQAFPEMWKIGRAHV